ncbi:hypothetical protein BD289DRAFT_351137, partial [Coniella lustricola]
AAAALDDQPSSRSFFSRFALPIRSRNVRNVVDFHIRPAEPHRKYNAGDAVRGAVILTVVKPIRVTHLTVALRGSVRVYKNANAANEPVSNADVASDGISRFRFLGNGYASLFQDEQVLCAEGKIDAGKYEFGFELMFPEGGLPSSIEFERGTIAYNITAILTRPSPTSPTMTCERKVDLIEQIDVGHLAAPPQRTIYLEPISKKSRRKKHQPSSISERQNPASDANTSDIAFDGDSTRAADTSTDGSNVIEELSQDVQHNPRSPVVSDLRSEVSGESVVSTSSRGADLNGQAGSVGTLQTNGGRRAISGERTIVTTIELMKGGCLPGDALPIRVNIQHTKPIRSMHGVIVTLYRQGRVDSAPPLSLFENLSKEDLRRLEKDEYLPKSKTGLGGLSLTSAGSCSVFRKDLSQSFTPLIIDPGTFTTSITTSVRVPEHAFPSIRGVPGEMISFKYRLEVIVDLGGKLSNTMQIGQNARVAAGSSGGLSSTRDMTAGVTSFDGSLVNTDTIKREKGVIFDSFEVIVGTKDSKRRGKAPMGPAQSVRTEYHDVTDSNESSHWYQGQEHDAYSSEDAYHYDHVAVPPPVMQYPYWNGGSREPSQQAAVPQYIPPPQLPDESALSEKERIRRAEQRLLPSRPPHTEELTAGPSQPTGDEVAGPSATTVPPPMQQASDIPEPSAPSLDDLTAGSTVLGATSSDDKQELERQRLLTEASAPPEFPTDDDAGVGSSTPTAGPSAPPPLPVNGNGAEPSAPMLNEEAEYGHQYTYHDTAQASAQASALSSEPLPAYQR